MRFFFSVSQDALKAIIRILVYTYAISTCIWATARIVQAIILHVFG
jgi:hypothetical protein